MLPERLSATAVDTFENCEHRYKLERLDKVPDLQGDAAALGTVFHETVQRWVEGGYYLNGSGWAEWEPILREEWEKLFSSTERWDEIVEMSQDWLATHGQAYWSTRQVISTEREEYFVVKFSENPSEPGATFFRFEIPFMVKMDRVDDLSGGARTEIEVVDYKTWMQPVQPGDVQYKIQAKCYAVAAQILFPTAEIIWVTFDQTRYSASGARFTKEMNRETYKYLQRVGRRVVASDGSKRTLNVDCRWCVARSTCPVLLANVEGEGYFTAMTIEQVVDQRALMHARMAAIKPMLDQYNEVLMNYCDDNGELWGITGNEYIMELKTKSKREADANMIRMVVGDVIAAKYPKMNLTQINKMLKEEDLTPTQIAQVNSYIKKSNGTPYPVTKPKPKL